VKPANLLLGDDGKLTLLDFGIAELIGEDPTHPARRGGEIIGSPAYMAPELVRGEAPSPAADLWSLGATLYTALEGRPPFPQRDVAPTLAAVLHDPPSATRHAGHLQPLLTRLLAKDPTARPSHDAVHTLLAEALPVSPALQVPAQRRRTPHPEPGGREALPDPADTMPQRPVRQARDSMA
jgi:serine/threonine protein kinase